MSTNAEIVQRGIADYLKEKGRGWLSERFELRKTPEEITTKPSRIRGVLGREVPKTPPLVKLSPLPYVFPRIVDSYCVVLWRFQDELAGLLFDTQNNPLPCRKIEINQKDTNIGLTESNHQGRFSLQKITPGRYLLKVNHSSFEFELPEVQISKRLSDFIKCQGRNFFMPIISLFNGQIFGYEALARDKDVDRFPLDLFEEAEGVGINMVAKLNMACIKKALEEVAKPQFPKDKVLFLNVCPHVFKTKEFQELFLKRDLPLPPWKIVFEIIEEDIGDIDEFKSVLRPFLIAGYNLATDDQGADGADGLRMLQLATRFVKADKDFVEFCRKNNMFGTFEGYVRDASKVNGLIIAEGVEDYWSAEDLLEFCRRQTSFGQGFLFGKAKPVEKIDVEIPKKAKKVLEKMWDLVEPIHIRIS